MSAINQKPDATDPFQLDIGRQLQELASMTNKESPDRYSSFYRIITASHFVLSEENRAMVEAQFLENTDEPAFIRAYAALALVMPRSSWWYMPGGMFKAQPYLESAMSFCRAVATKERKIEIGHTAVKNSKQARGVSVADILALIEEEYNVLRAAESLFVSLVEGEYGSSPATPEVRSEILQACKDLLTSGEQIQIQDLPTLNSKLFASVKALPEAEKTFLVAVEEDFDFVADRTDYLYRVTEVDLDRFHSGKRTKLFRHVTAVFCKDKQHYHKTLLSTFASSCMKNGAKKERPRHVLFGDPKDVDHPQVKMFMSMMGYTDIAAADPALTDLCFQTSAREISTSFKRRPYLQDYQDGISCGSCGHIGPKVSPCICGTVYYCGKECQKLGWKAHKHEHKAVMRKNEKKATKKGTK